MPKSINPQSLNNELLGDLLDETSLNHERMEWLVTLLDQIRGHIKDLPEVTGRHELNFQSLRHLTDIAQHLALGYKYDQQQKISQLEQQTNAMEGK